MILAEKKKILEEIENDFNSLIGGKRSREAATVRSKLSALKRQLETLENKADEKKETILTDVTYMNQFHDDVSQLSSVLQKSEEVSQTEPNRFESMDELLKHLEQNEVNVEQ